MAAHTRNRSRVAVVAGLRSAFCKAQTDLASLSAEQLGAAVVKELVARSEIPPQQIDTIIFGNVVANVAAPNVAREIVLASALPRSIHAVTVMRACASSCEAVTQAAQSIQTGHADVVIAGGVDSLSNVPILFSRRFADVVVRASRERSMAAKLKAIASLRPADLLPEPPAIAEFSTAKTMGEHAEMMAKSNAIPRAEQDAFALSSHQRAHAAQIDGRLAVEIAPVFVAQRDVFVDIDNHIRAHTSLAALAKLQPVFDLRYGSITAGSSCPVSDGASALLLMREDKAKAFGYAPLGYIRDFAYAAVDPDWQLLMGPTFACAKVLQRCHLRLADIDVVDMHEAFSAQVLSNLKAMASDQFAQEHLGLSHALGEIDRDRFNVMGGSIALGHPFAATAGRQIVTVLNELQRRGESLGLVTQCAAGGMGSALIVERD